MTVAWPEPAACRAVEPADPDVQIEALCIGAAVPAIVATAGWWLAVPYVAVVAAIGVPIGAVLAILAATRLAGPSWRSTSVMLGFVAPLVPWAVVAAGSIAGGLAATGDWGAEAIASGAALVAIALAVALIGGVPITLPTAILVGFLVRRAATVGGRRARRHVAALGIASAVVALPTLVLAGAGANATSALLVAPVDWSFLSGQVPLTVTIENHTRRERFIDVSWPTGDGTTNGWSLTVEPCTVSTDRGAVGDGTWAIIETDLDGLETAGMPLVRGADRPAGRTALTIVLEEDGRTTVHEGSREPAVPAAGDLSGMPVEPCG